MKAEDLKNLDTICAEAEAAGHGRAKRLRRRFVEYQQIGLLGGPTRKESRRGGAGLWHPVQAALFDLYLRHARNEFSLATLASVPIAFWLLGTHGIETVQVQRALLFKAGSILPAEWERGGQPIRRPTDYAWGKKRGRDQRERGDRSDVGRSAQRAIERITRPETPLNAKRALSKAVQMVTDGLPESLALSSPSLVRSTFVDAVTQARSDTGETRAVGAAISQMLSDRLLALSYVDILASDRPVVLDFWLWAREFWRLSFADYLADLPRLQASSSIGDLFTAPDDSEILSSSSDWLLGIFGSGIRWLQGDHGPGVGKHPPDPSLSRLVNK